MINELLNAMKAFEERNNISIDICLCSDGSGSIHEFWLEDEIEHFETPEQLEEILHNSNYNKGENGLCISPIEKI